MRSRYYNFLLSIIGGAAACLASVVVPATAAVTSGAAALATSLEDAWRACKAPKLSSAERIAYCTRIIESGRANPAARALALTARGFGDGFEKGFDPPH